jgi:cell division protein FtsQ
LQVEIEEHVALARWRDTALVNTRGEIFQAASSEPLPVFIAPEGTSLEVTEHYTKFVQMLAPLGKRPQRVSLSERRAWLVQLDDGQLLDLGRGETEERLQRFVSSYQRTIARLPQKPYRIDLRYPNGFAVRAGLMPPRTPRS